MFSSLFKRYISTTTDADLKEVNYAKYESYEEVVAAPYIAPSKPITRRVKRDFNSYSTGDFIKSANNRMTKRRRKSA